MSLHRHRVRHDVLTFLKTSQETAPLTVDTYYRPYLAYFTSHVALLGLGFPKWTPIHDNS